MGDLKKRKTVRLKGFNYNAENVFFITICTQQKQCTLSDIVEPYTSDYAPALDPTVSLVRLLPYGVIADKYIKQLDDFYPEIEIKRYVIMPNHIHLLVRTKTNEICDLIEDENKEYISTLQNSIISRFISTFKRFCNKEIGKNIWQYRSYDHVIRSEHDYDIHMKYIAENPWRWRQDELYRGIF